MIAATNNSNIVEATTYSIHQAIEDSPFSSRVRVVRVESSFGYTFIGHLSKTRKVVKIEVYRVEKSGLEIFQGYADDELFKKLARPLTNAAATC